MIASIAEAKLGIMFLTWSSATWTRSILNGLASQFRLMKVCARFSATVSCNNWFQRFLVNPARVAVTHIINQWYCRCSSFTNNFVTTIISHKTCKVDIWHCLFHSTCFPHQRISDDSSVDGAIYLSVNVCWNFKKHVRIRKL